MTHDSRLTHTNKHTHTRRPATRNTLTHARILTKKKQQKKKSKVSNTSMKHRAVLQTAALSEIRNKIKLTLTHREQVEMF